MLNPQDGVVAVALAVRVRSGGWIWSGGSGGQILIGRERVDRVERIGKLGGRLQADRSGASGRGDPIGWIGGVGGVDQVSSHFEIEAGLR